MSAISEKKHSTVAFFVLAYLSTWVYNATDKSLWILVLMHAAFTSGGNNIAAFTQPVAGGTWVPYIVNVLSAGAVTVFVVALNRTRMFSRQYAA